MGSLTLVVVPHVPTTIKAGRPALQVKNLTAISAQGKTPDAIVDRWARVIKAAKITAG